MRHRKAGRKLGRTTSHRKAMLRNMVTSLLKEEKIVTTDTKAKELRSVAEKMITLGKRGDLHARRQADAFIRESGVTKKLFEELSPRYSERAGGYTRIVKIGYRPGDNAPVSVIELMPGPAEKGGKKEPAAKKEKGAKKGTAAKREKSGKKEPAAKKEKTSKKEPAAKKA